MVHRIPTLVFCTLLCLLSCAKPQTIGIFEEVHPEGIQPILDYIHAVNTGDVSELEKVLDDDFRWAIDDEGGTKKSRIAYHKEGPRNLVNWKIIKIEGASTRQPLMIGGKVLPNKAVIPDYSYKVTIIYSWRDYPPHKGSAFFYLKNGKIIFESSAREP